MIFYISLTSKSSTKIAVCSYNFREMIDKENPRQSFGIHPYKIFVYLIIAGITVLFLSLSVAYAYTRVQSSFPAIKLPWVFLLNTVVLLASSVMLIRGKKHYQKDDGSELKQALQYTIVLTLIFLVGQGYGWYELFQRNISLPQNNGMAYLYLISGVHFAHVLVGLPFLWEFYRKAKRDIVEPVSALLYFSDPVKKMKLDLLNVYWHFLDGLWIYLVIFFAANYLLNSDIVF